MEETRWKEKIKPLDENAMEEARAHWMTVGKPLFSLGSLEDAVIQIAGIKGTSDFELRKRGLIIMCADNGVVEEGVTQTGQEVTAIVADNFTRGETSVCIMAEEAKVDLFPVDVGMATDVPSVTKKEYKVMYGTHNFAKEAAMTREEAIAAIEVGIQMVKKCAEAGYEILATGEMGIGNTTTSSAVASVLLGEDPKVMTGKGAGLTKKGLQKKVQVIREAVERMQPDKTDAIDVLSKVGGLDIAGLAGVYLGGAIYRIPVLIDGFISAVAALVAVRLVPECAVHDHFRLLSFLFQNSFDLRHLFPGLHKNLRPRKLQLFFNSIGHRKNMQLLPVLHKRDLQPCCRSTKRRNPGKDLPLISHLFQSFININSCRIHGRISNRQKNQILSFLQKL